MGTVVRFFGALLVSLLLAFIAGQLIATTFDLTEEYIAVMFGHVILGLVAIALFIVTYLVARSHRAFNGAALALTALLVVLTLLPDISDAVYSKGTSPYNFGKNSALMIALLLPGLVLILVQWGLLRRRWQTQRDRAGAMTCWPWVTTIVAMVAVINPFGLEILKASLEQSTTDWLRGLWTLVAIGTGALLLIGGVIEFGIRRRTWKARDVDAAKALAPDSEKWQQVFGDRSRDGS